MYENGAKLVDTSYEENVTELWNQQVHNDRTTPNNKPGKIIRENEKGSCKLMYVEKLGESVIFQY
jgi:hypothetical protein